MDAGNVDESWRQQPGTPVYCTNWDVEGVRHALSKADKSKSAEVRDAAMKKLQPEIEGDKSWENFYQTFRDIVEQHYGK